MPCRDNEESQLHVQYPRLSEVKQMFFQHVRSIVFKQYELRTLQRLIADYIAFLRNFGFDSSGKKSSDIRHVAERVPGQDWLP